MCGFTLGRSRNKVMVGEPVVGDIAIFLIFRVWYKGNISALGADVVSSSLATPAKILIKVIYAVY